MVDGVRREPTPTPTDHLASVQSGGFYPKIYPKYDLGYFLSIPHAYSNVGLLTVFYLSEVGDPDSPQ